MCWRTGQRYHRYRPVRLTEKKESYHNNLAPISKPVKSIETLVREDTVLRDRKGVYLQQPRLPFDTFELFYVNNRLDANAFMTARYRIATDNKVIPVLFKVWSVEHGFLAFLLSLPVFVLVKMLMLRRRLGSKNKSKQKEIQAVCTSKYQNTRIFP
ncbi:hypothetical protein [Neisseria uirgultaei]|uniref:hypothetical protein n=1 Tax=Neisseria uirgultaei TaxID=2830646 RepID=UPI002657FADF|nr:hypothetical protein [Neisseria uirgultaei]